MRRSWMLATLVAAALSVAGAAVSDRLNINIGVEDNGDVDITVEVPTQCPKNDPKDTKVHIPHETDCTKFYRCEEGKRIILECHVSDINGTKMHYDRIQQVCDWPERAGCDIQDNTTTQAITPEITTPTLPTALPMGSTTKMVSRKPTSENQTTVTIETTTRGNGVPTECPKVDPMDTTVHLAHETDCTKFYICDHGNRVLSQCPLMDAEGNRLYFNPVLQVCDWPDHAGCISTGTTTTEGTVYSTTTKETTRLTDKPTTVTLSTESMTEITNTRWPTEPSTESTTARPTKVTAETTTPKPWTEEPATLITDSTTVEPITNRPTDPTSSEWASEIPTEPTEKPVSNEPPTTNPTQETTQPTTSAQWTGQPTDSETNKTTSEWPSESPTELTKIPTSSNPSTTVITESTTELSTEKSTQPSTDESTSKWPTESTIIPTTIEPSTEYTTKPTTTKPGTEKTTESNTDTTPLNWSSEIPTESTDLPTSRKSATENLTNPTTTEVSPENPTESNTDTTTLKSSSETSNESTEVPTSREPFTQRPTNPTTIKPDKPIESNTDTTPLKSSSEIPTEPTDVPTSRETTTENPTTTERLTEKPTQSDTTTLKSSPETSTDNTEVPTSNELPTQRPTNPTTIKTSSNKPTDSNTGTTSLPSSSEMPTESTELPTSGEISTDNPTNPTTTERWTEKPTQSYIDTTTLKSSSKTFTDNTEVPTSDESPTQRPTNPTTIKTSTNKPTDSNTDTTSLPSSSEMPTESTELPTFGELSTDNPTNPTTTERWTEKPTQSYIDTTTLKSSSKTFTDNTEVPTSDESPTQRPTNPTTIKTSTNKPTDSNTDTTSLPSSSEMPTESTELPTSGEISTDNPTNPTTTERWTEKPTQSYIDTTTLKSSSKTFTDNTELPTSDESPTQRPTNPITIKTSTNKPTDSNTGTTALPSTSGMPTESTEIPTSGEISTDNPTNPTTTERWTEKPGQTDIDTTTLKSSSETPTESTKLPTSSEPLTQRPTNPTTIKPSTGKPTESSIDTTTLQWQSETPGESSEIPTSDEPLTKFPTNPTSTEPTTKNPTESTPSKTTSQFPTETTTESTNISTSRKPSSEYPGSVTTGPTTSERTGKPTDPTIDTTSKLSTESTEEPTPDAPSTKYTTKVTTIPTAWTQQPTEPTINLTTPRWSTEFSSIGEVSSGTTLTPTVPTADVDQNSTATPAEIYVPHENNCSRFYEIVNNEKILKECPRGWHFSPTEKHCDWPDKAGCELTTVVSTETTANPDSGSSCGSIGHNWVVAHECACNKYYTCSNGELILKECPEGLHFGRSYFGCVNPELAGCQSTTVGIVTDVDTTTKVILTDCPPDNSGQPVRLPHEANCSLFYECDNGNKILHQCQDDLHFNAQLQMCEWSDSAGCITLTTEGKSSERTTQSTKFEDGSSTSVPTECPLENAGKTVQLPHPYNCSLFYICDNGNKVVQFCPYHLEYNPNKKMCDWPEVAGCITSITKEPWTTWISSPSSTRSQDRSTEIPKISTEKLSTRPSFSTEKLTTPASSPTEKLTTPPNSTTEKWIKTTKGESTTVSMPNECPADNSGYAVHLPHPYNCSLFYTCDWGIKIVQSCPDGLEFNARKQVCDWPIVAGCIASPTKEPLTTSIWSTTVGTSQYRSTEPAKTSEDLKNLSTSTIEKLTTSPKVSTEKSTAPSSTLTEKLTTPPSSPTKKWTTQPSYTTEKLIETTKEEGRTSIAMPNECPPDSSGYAVQLPHPYNCSLFYKCDEGNKVVQSCPDGLEFNASEQICDWPEIARCVVSPTKEPLTTRVWSTTVGISQDRSTEPAETSENLKNVSTSTIEKLTTPPRVNTEKSTAPSTTVTEKLTTPPASTTKRWTTAASSTTEKLIQTTKAEGGTSVSMPNECPADNSGYAVHLPHPYNCSLFYTCDWGNKIVQSCPDGLEFNARKQVCDWPIVAGCIASPTKEPLTTRIWSTTVGTSQDRSREPVKTSEDLKNLSTSTIEKLTTPPGVSTEKSSAPSSTVTEKLTIPPSSPTKKWTTQSSYTTEKLIGTTKEEGRTSIAMSNECPSGNSGYAVQLPHPYNCSLFYKCDEGNKVVQSCPDGLEFNAREQICDWPEIAECVISPTKEPLTTRIWSTTVGTSQDHSTEPAKTSEDLKNVSTSTIEKMTTPPRVNTEKSTAPSSTVTEKLTTPPTSPTKKWTTAASSTTEKLIQTTKAEGGTSVSMPNECPPDNSGYAVHLPHPYNCSLFYTCDWGNKVVQSCPDGLEFNVRKQVCDWPIVAGCIASPTKEPLTTSIWSTTVGTSQYRSTEPAKTSEDLKNLSTSTIEKLTTSPKVSTEKSTAPSSTLTEKLTTPPSSPTKKWTTQPSYTTKKLIGTTKAEGGTSIAMPNECPPDNSGYAVQLPHPYNCSLFYKCDEGNKVVQSCPDGLEFNAREQICDWPEIARCVVSPTKEPLTTKVWSTTVGISQDRSTEPAETSENLKNVSTSTIEKLTTRARVNTEKSTAPSTTVTEKLTTPPASPTKKWTTAASSTTEKLIQTTKAEGGTSVSMPNECPPDNSGYAVHLPHPYNCSLFYTCDWGTKVVQSCPDGLEFNARKQVCDWPLVAKCIVSPTKQPLTTRVWSTTGGTSQERSTETAKTSEDLKNLSTSTSAKLTEPTRFTTEKLTTLPSSNTEKWTTTSSVTTNKLTIPPSSTTKEVTTSPNSTIEKLTTLSSSTTETWTIPQNTTSEKLITPPTSTTEKRIIPPNPVTEKWITTEIAVVIPICVSGSKLSHETNCSLYYECEDGIKELKECPPGLHFNPLLSICDWPANAGCEITTISTTHSPRPPITTTTEQPSPPKPTTTEQPSPPTTVTTEQPRPPTTTTTERPSPLTTTTEQPTPPKPTTTEEPITDYEIGLPDSCIGSCPVGDTVNSVLLPNKDCKKFCICSNGSGFVYDCPANLHFSPSKRVCDYPRRAKCEGIGGTGHAKA